MGLTTRRVPAAAADSGPRCSWAEVRSERWPGEGVLGPGVVRRPNHRLQVTVDKRPLYLYVGDRGPGQARGGASGTFFVVAPSGQPRRIGPNAMCNPLCRHRPQRHRSRLRHRRPQFRLPAPAAPLVHRAERAPPFRWSDPPARPPPARPPLARPPLARPPPVRPPLARLPPVHRRPRPRWGAGWRTSPSTDRPPVDPRPSSWPE